LLLDEGRCRDHHRGRQKSLLALPLRRRQLDEEDRLRLDQKPRRGGPPME